MRAHAEEIKQKLGKLKPKKKELVELNFVKNPKIGKIEVKKKRVKGKKFGVIMPTEEQVKKAAEYSGLELKNGGLVSKTGKKIKKWEFDKFKKYLHKEVVKEEKQEDLQDILEKRGVLTGEDYKKAGVKAEGKDLFWTMALDVLSPEQPVLSADREKKEQEALKRLIEKKGLTKKQVLKMIKEFEKKQAAKRKKAAER